MNQFPDSHQTESKSRERPIHCKLPCARQKMYWGRHGEKKSRITTMMSDNLTFTTHTTATGGSEEKVWRNNKKPQLNSYKRYQSHSQTCFYGFREIYCHVTPKNSSRRMQLSVTLVTRMSNAQSQAAIQSLQRFARFVTSFAYYGTS